MTDDIGTPHRRRRAVLEVLASATLFGTTGTSASFAPAAASTTAIGAARLVVGGLGLVVVLPLLGGVRAQVARLLRTPVGLAAAASTALYQLTFFAAIARTGVAIGTLVAIGSGPVLAGLISWTLLGERPTAAWWTSTAICIVGLTLLAIDGIGNAEGDLAGVVLALGAGASFAAYTVSAKRLMVRGAAPAESMATAFGGGAALLLPVLLVAGTGWLADARGAAIVLWLGLGTVSAAYVLFGRGLRVLPAGPVATLVLAEPLVATILGAVVLGERLGTSSWIGAALVAVGLAMQARASAGDRRPA
ncbi:MAG: DMT family transporter [Actinomycetota bacterium]